MTTHSPAKFMNPSTPPTLVSLVMLAAVGALAMNMFLPSLPSMARDFEVDYPVIQLSVTLFLAMNAVVQLFLGPLSDRYGRRPVALVSMIVFCIATVGTIIAPTIEMFLAARILQAAVVAGLVLSRAAIRDMYDASRAASVMGYVTMIMAVVPMLGPMIGGELEERFGWVSNFWVMLAAGGFAVILIVFDMGETNQHKSTSMAAQFRSYPELFRSRRFWAYCMSASSTVGAYFAYLGGGAFVGAEIFNMSPSTLGYFFGAPALGYAVGNGLSGAFSVRMGNNRMILTGATISTCGMVLAFVLFQITDPVPLSFFGPIVLVGVGNGMTLPNAMSGMMSVRPHLAGSASGIGGTIMTGLGSVLAAVTGSILTPGTGAEPLILIMMISSFTPLVFITYIVRRERSLQAAD